LGFSLAEWGGVERERCRSAIPVSGVSDLGEGMGFRLLDLIATVIDVSTPPRGRGHLLRGEPPDDRRRRGLGAVEPGVRV